MECSGLGKEAFHNLPPLSEQDLANTMKDVHLAVFLSRAESGTNLFATQALAMGIPTVVSNNTGHLDLTSMGSPICFPVSQMNTFVHPPELDIPGTIGWGESEVNDVVNQMRKVYEAYKNENIDDGKSTSNEMHNAFSWKTCYEQISKLISK
mmetsp:Transcript_23819/g.32760  ORF Transcript_23819/g.32760 Transcript_23819/m.32760 type:complete len:152 (+) Transcript_23819:261-716(+)